MRLLVFSPYKIGFSDSNKGYYGAGWIGAFLRAMNNYAPDVEIGIVFEQRHQIENAKGNQCESAKVYPLKVFQSLWSRLYKLLKFDYEATGLIPEIRKAIETFKPDVIHIFGSETPVGIVCGLTDIPCVVHIQGFLPSYENAKYPPGMNWKEDLPSIWLSPFGYFWRKHLISIYHKRAEREKVFLSLCQMTFGRTNWDRAIAKLYAPQAKYHYVSEVLREPFYENVGCWKWHRHQPGMPFCIISVISLPLFKGHDVILKTAHLLKQHGNLNFHWKVYGLEWGLEGTARRIGISPSENNVESCGVATAEELIMALKEADAFVLPSYIENSPNSLCEAQMLGVPCIATNVGGVATLIMDGETGLLVPANDPVMMTNAIIRIAADYELATMLGHNASIAAGERHNPRKIVADALEGYKILLDNHPQLH